jgi:hypothetical protein
MDEIKILVKRLPYGNDEENEGYTESGPHGLIDQEMEMMMIVIIRENG